MHTDIDRASVGNSQFYFIYIIIYYIYTLYFISYHKVNTKNLILLKINIKEYIQFRVHVISISGNARPTFMASSDSPTSSSPVNFTREYIDQTDSLLGSEFRASKSGVYLIFWNTIAKEMAVTTLLVNGKEAGRAATRKSQNSYSDNGSNLAVLRLQKDDVITFETNTSSDYVSISSYFLF